MHGLKSLLGAFLVAILVCGFVLAGAFHFGTVKASADVIGIINSDTTWTKANSPYTLTGPVGVAKGVTLTIEAGVTVNGAVIEMNGTLVARGSSVDPIHFNSVNIMFAESSNNWNEQTGSGSIIENAIISDTQININNTSPKINGNHIAGSILVFYEGAPVISNNIIETNRYSAIQIDSGPTVVLNNTIITNQVNYGIIANGPSSLSVPTPVILNNIVKGSGGKFGITAGTVHISDNVISGYQTGIYASGPAIIERNLIVNNYMGIDERVGR